MLRLSRRIKPDRNSWTLLVDRSGSGATTPVGWWVTMTQTENEDQILHILWMNGGLGCDGDSVALTAATQPSIEEIVLGGLPGLPRVAVHWPLLDFECGPERGADSFIEWWHRADLGELEPIVCVPGCPIHPDTLSETILYLLYQVAGQAPMIPLDEALRPRWLFEATVHEGCDRAGYYEQGEFAAGYGSPRCLVKLGCWGPVVKCNVPKRGWINGVGGCPNVGGICIACTMPGFPDKFMPFMDEPPGARVSTAASGMYGTVIRTLRTFTAKTLDKEPKWRVKGSELRTGYQKTW